MSEPRASQRFPQELIDHVIDFQHSSRNDLLNLSLVSRACLVPARRHIFHTIRVPATAPKIRLFSTSIVNGGPSLCHSVRELHLGYSNTKSRGTVELALPVILTSLCNFPRLQSLTFSRVDIGMGSTGLPATLPSRLDTSLRTLEFRACRIRGRTWQPLLRIIGMFKSIQDLRLFKLREVADATRAPRSAVVANESNEGDHRKTEVRSLQFVGQEHTPELLDGLSSTIAIDAIETLEVGYGHLIRRMYSRLVKEAAPTLKNVTITNSQYISTPSMEKNTDTH